MKGTVAAVVECGRAGHVRSAPSTGAASDLIIRGGGSVAVAITIASTAMIVREMVWERNLGSDGILRASRVAALLLLRGDILRN